jgi:hypothetical protein
VVEEEEEEEEEAEEEDEEEEDGPSWKERPERGSVQDFYENDKKQQSTV